VIGLAVPGQPIRSLVAEGRSAESVRDRMGVNPSVRTESVMQRSGMGSSGRKRSPRVQRPAGRWPYRSCSWNDTKGQFGLWSRRSQAEPSVPKLLIAPASGRLGAACAGGPRSLIRPQLRVTARLLVPAVHE
jgi:hypothetical protein